MTGKIDAETIARLAGVSRATVSRVINGYAFVKESTRQRVLKLVDEHAYSPHFSAQILAGKKSKTIGLFHLMLDTVSAKSRLEDTHINFMIERIIHTAGCSGYYTMVYQLPDHKNPEERRKIRDMFVQCRIDAGIFINFPNSCELIEDLIKAGFVIGIFNQHIEGSEPNRLTVRMDYSSVDAMVHYLAGLNHREIMFVGADMQEMTGVDIYAIFRNALRSRGLPVKEELILQAKALARTHAVDAFERFMDSGETPPRCILCANDSMAFGVIEALRKHALAVPADVSVAGSDDILVSQYFDPPLTTVRYDFDGMMKRLTGQVIALVEGKPADTPAAPYSGSLVIRASCRKI
jgi:LacI family transcriptional regulator